MSSIKNFPDEPLNTGKWLPIYFEPIIGSGERFTVCIAAICDDGDYKVEKVLKDELIKMLYNEKHKKVERMIEWIVSSFENHLKKSKKFNDWTPPFEGVFTGSIHEAQSDNLEGIFLQGIRLSSSLSRIEACSGSTKFDYSQGI